MIRIFTVMLKNNVKNTFLLFWSVAIPLLAILGIRYFSFPASADILLGIITFSIFSQCFVLQAFSVFSQRKRGVLELLLVTPFTPQNYLISITLSQSLPAVIISVLLLWIENMLYPLNPTLLQFFAFIPVFFIASLLFNMLGIAISGLADTESKLSIYTNLVLFLFLIPSSIFWSLREMPEWIRLLSWMSPFEGMQRSYRMILEGSPGSYLKTLLLLFLFFILSILAARMTIRMGRTY